VSKRAGYREALRRVDDWDAFIQAESGLPGPRANLELVQAVADEGDEARFRRWLAVDAGQASTNHPGVILPVCGAVGLGRLAAEGRHELIAELRPHAADPRWRVREGVAMGLQRLGAADTAALLDAMGEWAQGGWLEQRAVVAALCEPALLRRPEHARAVLAVLDGITEGIARASDRRDEAFRVLRQALGYGWSVAVAALPTEGAALFERLVESADSDVRWIARENLKKDRLVRLEPERAARWRSRVER
jgi:hypothetical protein